MLICYGFRIYTVGGYYVVSYALGIHLLKNFIQFISPHKDSDLLKLPTERQDEKSDKDEFRPFERQLPEHDCWKRTILILSIATACTFFKFFDIPVFWPILVIYFFVLFVVTFVGQLGRMCKYGYLPFDCLP
eukprot:UN14916